MLTLRPLNDHFKLREVVADVDDDVDVDITVDVAVALAPRVPHSASVDDCSLHGSE